MVLNFFGEKKVKEQWGGNRKRVGKFAKRRM